MVLSPVVRVTQAWSIIRVSIARPSDPARCDLRALQSRQDRQSGVLLELSDARSMPKSLM
jgi:hypothetical protein